MAQELNNGLRLYLKADEASGNLIDSTDFGNDAIPNIGSIDYSQPGILGTSIRLNSGGGSSFFHIPNTSDLFFSGSFSIAGWTNQFNEQGGSGALFGCWVGTTERSYIVFYSQTPNAFVFNVSPDGTSTNQTAVQSSTAPITFNVWYHVCAICNVAANTLSIYVTLASAGTLNSPDSTAFTDSGMWTGNTNQLEIGRLPSAGPGYFHGNFDELAMWDRAITAEEVAAHYNGGSGLALEDFGGGVDEAENAFYYYRGVA